MKEELSKGLSKAQIEKIRNCKNQEELLQLAKEEGVELTDEQLSAISGGGVCSSSMPSKCPSCGAGEYYINKIENPKVLKAKYHCRRCDHYWGYKD